MTRRRSAPLRSVRRSFGGASSVRALWGGVLLLASACDPTPTIPSDAGEVLAGEDGSAPRPNPPYRDVLELHQLAIAPTCSLNNGVCHNSSSFPDLRSPSAMIASATLPCSLSAVTREAVPNACEPPGDRFVITDAAFDAVIMDVEVLERSEINGLPTRVTLRFPSPVPAIDASTRGFEVRRGDRAFPLVPRENIRVESVDGPVMTLRIEPYLGESIQRFFDVSALVHPHDGTVRWADINGDGVMGATRPIPMITPGDPESSYLVLRLTNPAYGELMPRQCRTWSDDATQALSCWIEGLRADETGAVVNAYDPIDYGRCESRVRAGRCTTVSGTGFDAVAAVLARSCGGAGCHIGEASPAAGLDLSAGRARAALGAMSSQRPEWALVTPGAPETSYLYCKLSERCDARGTTARMPIGGVLPEADLEAIRLWIAEGAR